MDLESWLKQGIIKPFKSAKTQIDDLLTSAKSDLEASKEIIELGRYSIGRDTAYEAMLKAGMAFMFYEGFRPEVGSHHVTIIKFTKQAFGSKHQELVEAFDRLRRARHSRLYKGKEAVTKTQAESATKYAQQLIHLIEIAVAKKSNL